MVSGLLLTSFPPAVIRAGASSGGGRRRVPKSGGGNGRSSEPFYVDGRAAAHGRKLEEKDKVLESGEMLRPMRFAAFTEEKARELRIRTMETETFHNAMYHSVIAARLATDFPGRKPGRQ